VRQRLSRFRAIAMLASAPAPWGSAR
jgi:hypothetical protein